MTFTDAEDAKDAKEKLQKEKIEGRPLILDLAEPRHRQGGAAAAEAVEKKQERRDAIAEARKKAEEEAECNVRSKVCVPLDGQSMPLAGREQWEAVGEKKNPCVENIDENNSIISGELGSNTSQ